MGTLKTTGGGPGSQSVSCQGAGAAAEREEEDVDGARDDQAEGAGRVVRQGIQGLEVRVEAQKAVPRRGLPTPA